MFNSELFDSQANSRASCEGILVPIEIQFSDGWEWKCECSVNSCWSL